MKKYAFVDVDGTIVDGNLGEIFAKELLKRGQPFRSVRSKFHLVLYVVKGFVVAALAPFSFLLPVYNFLQAVTSAQYFDLVEMVPEDMVHRAAERAVKNAKIHPAAIEFLKELHERGYEIVLLSASPTILLERLTERIPLPVRYVGLDEKHPFPMSWLGKAIVILTEFSDGVPAVVVGNPKREPFFLAKDFHIVVKSPRDLRRYLDLSQPGQE